MSAPNLGNTGMLSSSISFRPCSDLYNCSARMKLYLRWSDTISCRLHHRRRWLDENHWVLFSTCVLVDLNRCPRTGISPRNGTLDSLSSARSSIKPPSTSILTILNNHWRIRWRLAKRTSTAPFALIRSILLVLFAVRPSRLHWFVALLSTMPTSLRSTVLEWIIVTWTCCRTSKNRHLFTHNEWSLAVIHHGNTRKIGC